MPEDFKDLNRNINETSNNIENLQKQLETFHTTFKEGTMSASAMIAKYGTEINKVVKVLQSATSEAAKLKEMIGGEVFAQSYLSEITFAYQQSLIDIGRQYGVNLEYLTKSRTYLQDMVRAAREFAEATGDAQIKAMADTIDRISKVAPIMGSFGQITGVIQKFGGPIGGEELFKTLQQGAASKISNLMLGFGPAGAGLLAGVGVGIVGLLKAFQLNLATLKDRVEGGTAAFSATSGSLDEVRSFAKKYHGEIGTAAAAHLMEADEVKKVTSLLATRVPGSLERFLKSTDDMSLTLTTARNYARLLGVEVEKTTSVLSEFYSVQRTAATSEQRRVAAARQLNITAAYAQRLANDEIMTRSMFLDQLEGAIKSTSDFQTDSNELGAVMDSLARIHSKSAPALENIGAAAAQLTQKMRGFDNSLRVLLGGGFGGIWSWAEQGPASMMKQLQQSFLGQFIGLGPQATAQQKSLALMVLQSMGIGEQQARWMIEMGKISEAQVDELSKTRQQSREANETFKEIHGTLSVMHKQLNALVSNTETIAARLGQGSITP